MKKLLLFALPLFLFACKSGIQTHKAAIEELSTNWDNTTNTLTELSNSVTKEMTSYTESASSYMLDETTVASLKGDVSTKWQEAVKSYKTSTSDAYAPLQSEMSNFINMWMEHSSKVTALKDGLATGKYEGDPTVQIAELSELVTQANEKIAAWTAKKGELSTAANSAVESLKTAYATATAK